MAKASLMQAIFFSLPLQLLFEILQLIMQILDENLPIQGSIRIFFS